MKAFLLAEIKNKSYGNSKSEISCFYHPDEGRHSILSSDS